MTDEDPTAPDGRTDGHLLDGCVRYTQPLKGFRSGIEPVLLAASVPAKPGERVLEGGTGAGATLLCLAARVSGLEATGVERDAALVALARLNAAANNWPGLNVIAGDVADLADVGTFDHACANPPYHPPAGTPSPDAARAVAKIGPTGVFQLWATALAHRLRPRGTLTFILPAAELPACLGAFEAAGCTPTAMLPLWPKAGQPAKLMLLRGIKGGRSAFRIASGLTLHESDGAFTKAAEAVLRHAQPLPF